MTVGSETEIHVKETHQIVLLLGELKGQVASLMSMIQGQGHRLDRQDERLATVEQRQTDLRRDVFKGLDAHKSEIETKLDTKLGDISASIKTISEKNNTTNNKVVIITGIIVGLFVIIDVFSRFAPAFMTD